MLAGEIPLRDFKSYDPGRYYWTAAWLRLFNSEGLAAVRAVQYFTQAIGFFLALGLLARTPKMGVALAATAMALLASWMFPYYKLVDFTVCIGLVSALAWLLELPSRRRFFVTGMAVGLAAVFGRNHGLYGALGAAGTALYIFLGPVGRTRALRKLAFGVAGMGVGFLPVLLMIALVPGFGDIFLEGVARTASKSAPIHLPYPWLWRVDFGQRSQGLALRDSLVSVYFSLNFLLALLGPVYLLWRQATRRSPLPPLAVAGTWLALGYLHYVLSRADVWHLAVGILPGLLATFAYLPRLAIEARVWTATGIAVTTLYATISHHPGWLSRSQGWVQSPVGGTTIWMHSGTRANLRLLEKLHRDFAPKGGPFLVVPYWPGAYAIYGQRSPIWSNYAIREQSPEKQRQEMKQIARAKPRFVLLLADRLDQNPKRQFAYTNSKTTAYIQRCFTEQRGYLAGTEHRVFGPGPRAGCKPR